MDFIAWITEDQMYSNLTEMDGSTKSGTSQNINPLITGYFIENYSEDDSYKENNSTSKTDAILESKNIGTANKYPHPCTIFTANK